MRSLFLLQDYVEGAFASVFYAHLAVTVMLALLAWRLCVKCEKVHRHLRFAELLIFAGPAAFFLFFGYHKLILCAELGDGHSHIPNISGAWTLLIFSYALFVPNTWRRACIGHLLMGVCPLAIMGLAYMRSESFAALSSMGVFQGVFIEHSLIMLLAVVTATVGVKSIGSLRREAFVARQLGQY